MDPFSIAELAITITEVVERLYDYIVAVRDAQRDIMRLTQELFALKGALEHFESQNKRAALDDGISGQVDNMLRLTRETLDTIQKKLVSPKSGLGRAMQRLAWPFHAGDIEKYLGAIERAKTWFLMVLMKDSSDTTLAIYDEMKRLANVVHEDVITRQADAMMQELSQTLEWLAPFNSAEELLHARADRVTGSGQWIWDSAIMSAWENDEKTSQQMIWVTGKSGSGKTVLFSSIVEALEARGASDKKMPRLCAFHLCSLDSDSSQKVSNVFGSILAAAIRLRPELGAHVRPFRTKGTQLVPENSLTPSQIHQLMDTAVPLFGRVFILVDALNETPFDGQIVSMLLALCERHANVRVLTTSTRMPEPNPRISIKNMTAVLVDSDIDSYVLQRLSSEQAFRSITPAMKAEIERTIVAGAKGMFRWATLCMDRLASFRTGRQMKAALNDLPTTLNDTYVRMIERIPDVDKPMAREALQWLCFSLRPMHLDEIAEAVIVEEGDTILDGDYRLTNPEIILDICQGLIHFITDANTVTLAHDSIRTFLVSDWIKTSAVADFHMNPAEANRVMMRKCLTYLRLDSFSRGPLSSAIALERAGRDHPLLRYVTYFWPIHSERSTLLPEDETFILDFFNTSKEPGGSSFASWVQFLLESTDLQTIRRTEPLYYAASYNLVPILKILLKPGLGIDINKPGGRYGSPPLFVAAWRGNIEAVNLLMEAGASVDSLDAGSGMTVKELLRHTGLPL